MSSATHSLKHLAELPNLRAQCLTRLARLTGVPIGGPKAALSARLAETLVQPKLFAADIDAQRRVENEDSDHGSAKVHRVLSIDMGIRNLAYCRLLVKRDHHNSNTTRKKSDHVTETSPLGSISVQTWRRFPLSSKTLAAEVDPDTDVEEPPRELFTPPVLAKHALSLLHGLVLHAPEGAPDTVLIERQRWRSGGHSAVQEWTLRVNSVEAMLWSGLEVLKDQGIWNGSVHAVDPGAVTRFWNGDAKKAALKGAKQDDEGKKGKIAVAKRWIDSGVVNQTKGADDADVDIELKPGFEHESPDQRLSWEETTHAMRDAFMWVRSPEAKTVMQVDGQKLHKKDDLADCLLQGVAWVKWEQNRRAIVRDHAGLDKPAVGVVLAPKTKKSKARKDQDRE